MGRNIDRCLPYENQAQPRFSTMFRCCSGAVPAAARSGFAAITTLVLLLSLVFSVVLESPASAAESPDALAMEQQFVDAINTLRATNGLQPLQVDAGLVAPARRWSKTMADAGDTPFHTRTLGEETPGPWRIVGENVGVGGSVTRLEAAFEASPLHLKNLMEPRFKYVGIGIALRDGRIFVTERFSDAATAEPAAAVSASSSKSNAQRLAMSVRAPRRTTRKV